MILGRDSTLIFAISLVFHSVSFGDEVWDRIEAEYAEAQEKLSAFQQALFKHLLRTPVNPLVEGFSMTIKT